MSHIFDNSIETATVFQYLCHFTLLHYNFNIFWTNFFFFFLEHFKALWQTRIEIAIWKLILLCIGYILWRSSFIVNNGSGKTHMSLLIRYLVAVRKVWETRCYQERIKIWVFIYRHFWKRLQNYSNPLNKSGSV